MLAMVDLIFQLFSVPAPEDPYGWTSVFIDVLDEIIGEICPYVNVRAYFVLNQGESCIEQDNSLFGPAY